jgi:hypothetical protein
MKGYCQSIRDRNHVSKSLNERERTRGRKENVGKYNKREKSLAER